MYALLLIPLCLASARCILFVFVIWVCFILFIPLTNIIHRCRPVRRSGQMICRRIEDSMFHFKCELTC